MDFKKRARGLPAQKGFTLIELLAVVAIMVVVSSIILANNNEFGGQVQLQNFAYDVALSIRQAQVYGISVQGFSTATSPFAVAYGVEFDPSENNALFILYADANGNGTYNGSFTYPQNESSGSEFVQGELIGQNYSIENVCVSTGTGACTPVDKLDILFLRPEPDAYINPTCSLDPTGAEVCKPSAYTSAQITLESPRGDTTSVTVTNSGQIEVDQTITP